MYLPLSATAETKHTEEVTGSIPVSPTTYFISARPLWAIHKMLQQVFAHNGHSCSYARVFTYAQAGDQGE